jgi:hypothetical protein
VTSDKKKELSLHGRSRSTSKRWTVGVWQTK